MSKYDKLVQDLIEARQASIEAGKGEDGGSVNFDRVFLQLPRWREEDEYIKKIIDLLDQLNQLNQLCQVYQENWGCNTCPNYDRCLLKV